MLLSNAVMYDLCDSLFKAASLRMKFTVGDALHVFSRHLIFDEELFDSKTEERLTQLHMTFIGTSSPTCLVVTSFH